MAENFGAVLLNGTNQYVRISHASAIDFLRQSFSASIFFKSSSSGILAQKHNGTTGWKIELLATGAVRGTVNATTVSTSATSYADNGWHYAELTLDQDAGIIYLLADRTINTAGFAQASISNSSNILLGSDLTTFHNCKLSEFRLSNLARNKNALTRVPVFQFSDDPATLILLHMNEGHDSTVMDTSAAVVDPLTAPQQFNGIIVGFDSDANVWSESGPLLAAPQLVCREITWFALDADSDMSDFAAAYNLRRFRARDGDPDAQNAPAPSFDNCPYIFVHPGPIPSQEFAGAGYNEMNVPIVIAGWAKYGSPDFISQLSYLVSKAIWTRFGDTGGGMGQPAHINTMNVIDSGIVIAGRDTGAFFQGFEMTMVYQVRRNLVSRTQP